MKKDLKDLAVRQFGLHKRMGEDSILPWMKKGTADILPPSARIGVATSSLLKNFIKGLSALLIEQTWNSYKELGFLKNCRKTYLNSQG